MRDQVVFTFGDVLRTKDILWLSVVLRVVFLVVNIVRHNVVRTTRRDIVDKK